MTQILFIRSLLVLIISLLGLFAQGKIHHLHTTQPFRHMIRTLTHVWGYAAFTYALSLLPFADAVAFVLSTPLVVAVFSGLVLSESTKLRHKAAAL